MGRTIAVLLLAGCNAVTGLDDLSFVASVASSTVGSGGEAGSAPGGMGGRGQAGAGGEPGCVASGNPKRVFVTDEFYAADSFGGLSGADAVCQAAADGVSLGGCWRAWLSDEAAGAPARVCPGGPWYRLDAEMVAMDCTDLLDGDVASPIHRTQTQRVVSVGVWTGTAALGGTLSHCDSWTSSAPSTQGIQGSSSGTSVDWSDSGATECGDVGAFYCFEL